MYIKHSDETDSRSIRERTKQKTIEHQILSPTLPRDTTTLHRFLHMDTSFRFTTDKRPAHAKQIFTRSPAIGFTSPNVL